MKKESNQILLPVVFAIALVLRLAGITHGFPFIFHPDEPAVIRTALGLRFYLNPGHFDWPHLYMYLNYSVYMIFAWLRKSAELVGLKQTISAFLPLIWNESLIFYLITRVFSALLGALTVIPVYLAGRESFGKKVGILAALAFALLPFHVRHSHYALIDVPMVFFAAWGMFYALNILKRRDPNDYSGAGFYTGLAASTKYHGGLAFLLIPFSHIIRIIKTKERFFTLGSLGVLGISIATAIIGFLMGTPYAILDYQTFLTSDGPTGALWQFKNVGSVPLAQRLPNFFNEMVYKVADDTGYVILAALFIVMLLLIYRRVFKRTRPEDTTLAFLVVSALFFLAYISGFAKSRSHYFMIAYPYLAVVFGYLVSRLLDRTQKVKFLAALIFMLMFSLPAFLSAKQAYLFSNSDTRVVLYNWLLNKLVTGDVVFYNKSNLASVAEKFPNVSKKGIISAKETANGYLVLSDEQDCKCFDYPLVQYRSKIKNLLQIDNNYRLGPKIQVYSFNK